MRMKAISVRLPEEMIRNLEKLEKELGISRSEIIRDALRIYIDVLSDYLYLTKTKYPNPLKIKLVYDDESGKSK